ncbi:MAG TPA: amidohydrolase family protein [Bryobacteraceae bacterium]|nr:amidohydrolase family protein [Bryobacteraceae bacterium]
MTRRELMMSAGLAPVAMAGTPDLLASARGGRPLVEFDIVDAHGHIQEVDRDAVWPRASADLVAAMDRCGIGQCVFSHLSAIMAVTLAELRAAHDESERAVERHPGRLRAYAVFPPNLGPAALREVERALESPAFAGVKMHGPIHEYSSLGPAYRDAYRLAASRGVPVLLHAREGAEATKSIAAVANETPGLKLLLAHMWPGARHVPDLLRLAPNLYVDTCATAAGFRMTGRLLEEAPQDRIVFGTDATYLDPGGQVGKLAFADAPESVKRRVFGTNARVLFGKRLPERRP